MSGDQFAQVPHAVSGASLRSQAWPPVLSLARNRPIGRRDRPVLQKTCRCPERNVGRQLPHNYACLLLVHYGPAYPLDDPVRLGLGDLVEIRVAVPALVGVQGPAVLPLQVPGERFVLLSVVVFDPPT